VLSRYYRAADRSKAEIVVRVTADCPLLDGALLGTMMRAFAHSRQRGEAVDYLSNTLARTYPRGLDAEIFSFAALEHAYERAAEPFEREHVTPFIYNHPELFALRNFAGTEDHSRHRWTLDTQEDWQLIEAIYAALHRPGRLFGMQEVLAFLGREPALCRLNADIIQKATNHA